MSGWLRQRVCQAEGAQRLIESGMLDDLFAKIDAGEVQLDGDGGFIQQLIKTGLERGLQAELTEHVGYEKGDPEARFHENSRNGSFPKTVGTTAGEVELRIPRDRDGSFTPRLVPTGARRLSQLDEMIISLYAGGMTVRDIEHHLVSTLGVDLSHETISNITEEIADEVLAWQSRPLEAFYPVIYLDALVVKVRDGGHVRNKAAHIAVGVDMDGVKRACPGSSRDRTVKSPAGSLLSSHHDGTHPASAPARRGRFEWKTPSSKGSVER